ncbi:MAG: peptidase domain-containing ABC transporter [Agriterribacter sp.]
MTFLNQFPLYRQLNSKDCGPTCLKMIASYYGKKISIENLRNKSQLNKDGVSLLGLCEAAESIGFKTVCSKIDFKQLLEVAPLPCIVHWNQNHFVVVTPKSNKKRIVIADPANGFRSFSGKEFTNHWYGRGNLACTNLGVVLMLEPTGKFMELENEKDKPSGWNFLTNYLYKHKNSLLHIALSLFIGSIIQLIFPFLTQSLVDNGVNQKNIQYIYIVLLAQLMLFFARSVVEFIRSRILLHISMRINISLISDFWIKLMRLPVSYFDARMTGDILQRLNDQKRIENFITNSSISSIFSIMNLLIFSFVLVLYDKVVFFIFSGGSIIYFIWISAFLKYKRKLDIKRFELASQENNLALQFIHGMQEIKLNNASLLKRWKWEELQASIFRMNFRNLSINQYQQAGAIFINEGKNIIITFLVAKAVVDGYLTLGGMLAIQYILGQLNSPIDQLVGFVQTAQEAKLSLERLVEIHGLKNEKDIKTQYISSDAITGKKNIELKCLSFTYPGAGNPEILRDISLTIYEGQITAIVGMSGSGKTTLLKLLLKFYNQYTGDIQVGSTSLKHFDPDSWRNSCGCVLQSGFIFSDTIAANIAVGFDAPEIARLVYAAKIANILTFIESLPQGFGTKIGAGNGISEGQRQRILIARAVYKNPKFIFFDEATNALDANNEKAIVENLQDFFKEKTVVIVAHRLSTVKNADNIVVLNNGVIVESGSHHDLSEKKGITMNLSKIN